MGYEKDKDKNLFEKEIDLGGQYSIVIGVYQYEDGEPKLQMSRKQFSDSGHRFIKLGRLSLDEVNHVLPVIEEAKKHMIRKKDTDS